MHVAAAGELLLGGEPERVGHPQVPPFRTSCGSTGTGDVASAATRAPARPAASAASDRHRRTSRASSPRSRHRLVLVSSCCRCSSNSSSVSSVSSECGVQRAVPSRPPQGAAGTGLDQQQFLFYAHGAHRHCPGMPPAIS